MFFKKILQPKVILGFMIALYIGYFSYFSILRYQTLYASYFDLGIMHQATYNTFTAIRDLNPSRVLELTDPHGVLQMKRMGIHNDVALALIAPLYFINSTPAMLLIVQSIVVALGAIAIFLITQTLFKKHRYVNLLALTFSFSYLMNPVLQRANIYDFHAVVLATTTLLFMFYFWLTRRYYLSFLFLILSLATKEQVPLTTAFFGLFIGWQHFKHKKDLIFPTIVFIVSVAWFVASVFFVIPYFRGGDHFAVARYSKLGDSPAAIITGLFKNPILIVQKIFAPDALTYLINLLGPLGFLSLLAPVTLLIATPEFGINLLSESRNMRNIIYQYTAVLQPFIFVSAIYGASVATTYLKKRYKNLNAEIVVISYILIMTCLFAWWKGPLPMALDPQIHPYKYPQKEASDTRFWSNVLKDENLKIMSTGQLSPYFTSRQYFYTFSKHYPRADYIVLRINEIYNYPEKQTLIPVYETLQKDPKFQRIFFKTNFEVYKKIKN